jgi:single-strand DNA-binding protein
MKSYNKVILMGHIGMPPEIKENEEKSKYVVLSLATNDSWKDREGNKRQITDWHRVVIFNEALVSITQNYLKKGSKVLIEGQLKTRKWIDDMGKENFISEIVLSQYQGSVVLLDKKASEQDQGNKSIHSSQNLEDSHEEQNNISVS